MKWAYVLLPNAECSTVSIYVSTMYIPKSGKLNWNVLTLYYLFTPFRSVQLLSLNPSTVGTYFVVCMHVCMLYVVWVSRWVSRKISFTENLKIFYDIIKMYTTAVPIVYMQYAGGRRR